MVESTLLPKLLYQFRVLPLTVTTHILWMLQRTSINSYGFCHSWVQRSYTNTGTWRAWDTIMLHTWHTFRKITLNITPPGRFPSGLAWMLLMSGPRGCRISLPHKDMKLIQNPVILQSLELWGSAGNSRALTSSHLPLQLIPYNPFLPSRFGLSHLQLSRGRMAFQSQKYPGIPVPTLLKFWKTGAWKFLNITLCGHGKLGSGSPTLWISLGKKLGGVHIYIYKPL